MPIYVHVIEHPDARVLVDTGMTELHPLLADMDPSLMPLSEQKNFDIAGIDMVVNTHLHGDHCGGNHLFAGKPIYAGVRSSSAATWRSGTASSTSRPPKAERWSSRSTLSWSGWPTRTSHSDHRDAGSEWLRR
jgi:glyoxylase-like metal-dependent hydrolase (beta-lactamase superfamily II)